MPRQTSTERQGDGDEAGDQDGAARLYIVRHGAAEDHHALGDGARALTAEGRDEFRELAGELGAKLAGLRTIATSPLVRAVQTAEILATACEISEVVVRAELAAERASGQSVALLARELGPGWALVGHNPSLADALALLLGLKESPASARAPSPPFARPPVPARTGRWTGWSRPAGKSAESSSSTADCADRAKRASLRQPQGARRSEYLAYCDRRATQPMRADVRPLSRREPACTVLEGLGRRRYGCQPSRGPRCFDQRPQVLAVLFHDVGGPAGDLHGLVAQAAAVGGGLGDGPGARLALGGGGPAVGSGQQAAGVAGQGAQILLAPARALDRPDQALDRQPTVLRAQPSHAHPLARPAWSSPGDGSRSGRSCIWPAACRTTRRRVPPPALLQLQGPVVLGGRPRPLHQHPVTQHREAGDPRARPHRPLHRQCVRRHRRRVEQVARYLSNAWPSSAAVRGRPRPAPSAPSSQRVRVGQDLLQATVERRLRRAG